MNYISRLRCELSDAEKSLLAVEERIAEFRAHLCHPKFWMPASDGSRTDWIATADVNNWLEYIRFGR